MLFRVEASPRALVDVCGCGQVPWVLDGASVVGQDVGAGGCGGVVGVGVVDLDVVDGGRLAGGGNGVDGDGVPVVVAQAVAGLDVSGGGEALAVDVQGVGWCGLQVVKPRVLWRLC